MSAVCSCGESAPHVIAKRETADHRIHTVFMDKTTATKATRTTMTPAFKTTHPGREANYATTPWNIWSSAVYEIAGCSVEDARRYATRERIQRAYHAGEAAWMAADTVQQLVAGGRRADRADDEVDGLRQAVHDAIRR